MLRLTTSLILGGRELGADGVMTLELCDRLLDAYARAAFGSGRLPTRPGPVRALVQQVRARTRKELLEGRTMRTGKARSFVLGDPDDSQGVCRASELLAEDAKRMIEEA